MEVSAAHSLASNALRDRSGQFYKQREWRRRSDGSLMRCSHRAPRTGRAGVPIETSGKRRVDSATRALDAENGRRTNRVHVFDFIHTPRLLKDFDII